MFKRIDDLTGVYLEDVEGGFAWVAACVDKFFKVASTVLFAVVSFLIMIFMFPLWVIGKLTGKPAVQVDGVLDSESPAMAETERLWWPGNDLAADGHYNIPLEILDLLTKERYRQNKKWGEQNHPDEFWLAILSEEVGEVAEALLHNKFGGKAAGTLRNELVQVTAVAVQWLECLERNGEIVEGK